MALAVVAVQGDEVKVLHRKVELTRFEPGKIDRSADAFRVCHHPFFFPSKLNRADNIVRVTRQSTLRELAKPVSNPSFRRVRNVELGSLDRAPTS